MAKKKKKEPRPKRTEAYERIGEIRFRSAYHREQLEAQVIEFIELHGYADDGSFEADTLAEVILDGAEYAEAIEKILEFKKGVDRA